MVGGRARAVASLVALALVGVALLAGCSSDPPPPRWEEVASGSFDGAKTEHLDLGTLYLTGRVRLAWDLSGRATPGQSSLSRLCARSTRPRAAAAARLCAPGRSSSRFSPTGLSACRSTPTITTSRSPRRCAHGTGSATPGPSRCSRRIWREAVAGRGPNKRIKLARRSARLTEAATLAAYPRCVRRTKHGAKRSLRAAPDARAARLRRERKADIVGQAAVDGQDWRATLSDASPSSGRSLPLRSRPLARTACPVLCSWWRRLPTRGRAGRRGRPALAARRVYPGVFFVLR